MATITQVADTIQKVLGEQIETLARQSGFIQRQVTLTGCGFVQALVLAFQAERTASYSELSQAASSLGMPMSAQGMEKRRARPVNKRGTRCQHWDAVAWI